jgi:cobyrinic acid a,c-diamide synthase
MADVGTATLNIPRLVIAGTHSGVGKTTVAVGLARALSDKGLSVACFKCGPDYLDPTYHAYACGGRPSVNLDSWLMDHDTLLATFAGGCAGHDIAIIEGVMGLYDGISPHNDAASTAQIAKWLRAPVVLVADAAGMARSADALVSGFVGYDREVEFGGVILNRVSGTRHGELLRECIKSTPVIGALARSDRPFGARHLGLKSAGYDPDSPAAIEAAAKMVGALDLEGLLAIAGRAQTLGVPGNMPLVAEARSAKVRIAVARDEAFHFYYPHNLALLEASGAELVNFSPLNDSSLPDVDGIIIGGGYPELYAAKLAGNLAMKRAIQKAATSGLPIYAECGGLIYLARELITRDGESHELLGLLPGRVTMHGSLQALGYVTVSTRFESMMGPAGSQFRGHEFRYSQLTLDEGVTVNDIYEAQKVRTGERASCGFAPSPNILASYVHAHWGASPLVAAAFVARCAQKQ